MSPARIVGIAGVGLIGASIGLRAVAGGATVIGWDPSPEHARIARRRGAIGEDLPTFATLVARADILVIAAPLDATLALVESLATSGVPPRASLVIDVASVKAPVAHAGASLANFVATHPIAGSERSGPLAARADLFEGRTWTYDSDATPEAVARARDFIASLGALPFAIASEEHDRIVALSSHAPQLLSVALGARLGPELGDARVRALCGTGVRSMLRLGASSWPIWRAILAANRDVVAQEVRTLASVLSRVADALDDDHIDVLEVDFAAAAAAVAALGANASPSDAVTVATTSSPETTTSPER